MAGQSYHSDRRLEFESDDKLIRDNLKKRSKRKRYIIGGIAVAVVVAVAIGLIVYFVTEDSDDSGSSGTTTPAPEQEPEEEDLVKIDCYPEAGSPQEELTREKCEARGCIYEPSIFDEVPACYVDVNSAGFELLSEPSEVTTNVMEYFLRPKNSQGMFGQQFENVSFKVEMLEDHILHFSVSI